jgi:hypothetical protein
MSNEKVIKCDLCGITFATQQDREERIKLEHEKGQQPTGVTLHISSNGGIKV